MKAGDTIFVTSDAVIRNNELFWEGELASLTEYREGQSYAILKGGRGGIWTEGSYFATQEEAMDKAAELIDDEYLRVETSMTKQLERLDILRQKSEVDFVCHCGMLASDHTLVTSTHALKEMGT